MCVGAASMAEDRPGTFEQERAQLESRVGPPIRRLNDDYVLHGIETGRSGDVGILHQGQLVAFYVDQTIAVSDRHQGRSLSIPMILEGSKHRALPPGRSHTAAGKKAFEKAWRIANGFEPHPWP